MTTQRGCCEKCYQGIYNGHAMDCEHNPRNWVGGSSEKPVQEHRPKLSRYLQRHEGYIPAAPVQGESDVPETLRGEALRIVPSLGEGWEQRFLEECGASIVEAYHEVYTDVEVPERYQKILSFITNLLASEREKWGDEFEMREQWVSESARRGGIWEGTEAERARIAAGVGRLRDKFHPATENGLFLNAILKIIHSEG